VPKSKGRADQNPADQKPTTAGRPDLQQIPICRPG
jgi:hypothetical protein